MDFLWNPKPIPNPLKVSELAKSINVIPKIAEMLIQRGIESYEDAEKFFRPKLEDLHDPFLMKDMDKAIDRIHSAIEQGEKMMIYGDYDVDGTTSVSVVYSFFRGFNNNIEYYIPDRYKEGYGISKAGIDYAAENGFNLIVALDCGIRSNEIVAYASSLGIDFVICDHHLPGAELPAAVAVLDPKREDCEYPYKELSGCGIGFKLIQAYCQKMGLNPNMAEEYLDLVAVSIASDIVDIRGENRILAFYGLKKLNEDPCIGLQSLLQNYPIKDKYTISDIVFGIGPRINAAGRIADGKSAVKLLIERDYHRAVSYCRDLSDLNTERKGFDQDITSEAIGMVNESDELQSKNSTVLFGKNWHKGVIGIVASRLVEQFYKPTIIFSENNGTLTGSARSVKDFDIHEAIGACGEYVEQFGGHKYAAGLSVKLENLEHFAQKFEEVVSGSITDSTLIPKIDYDVELDLTEINAKLIRIIDQMGPFGPGNMLPVFRTNNLMASGMVKILKEKHLKLTVGNGKVYFDAIGFGMGNNIDVVTGRTFDAAYSIEENVFNGRTSTQLKLRDVK